MVTTAAEKIRIDAVSFSSQLTGRFPIRPCKRAPARGGEREKNQYTKGIQFFLPSQEGPGYSKRNGAKNIDDIKKMSRHAPA